MKRSEMISKMLETSTKFHGEIVSKDLEYRLINALLSTIEINGMLPPSIENESEDRNGNWSLYKSNEWDLEDEEQLYVGPY